MKPEKEHKNVQNPLNYGQKPVFGMFKILAILKTHEKKFSIF
jgi:hypothetical protein